MVSDIDRRKGLSATAAAEVFWGLTPIYWKAVATVSTHELLALRVLWAIPFAVVLLTLRDAWGDVWRAVSSWHTLSALLLTAALIGCNWFAFLIAMENGQILQSSLGYFITPLVSILLGFVFLGERLHAVQWVAVALAAAGVANQKVPAEALASVTQSRRSYEQSAEGVKLVVETQRALVEQLRGLVAAEAR